MTEEAVLIGEGRTLAGIVTQPAEPAAGAPAVVLLNAGRVHRVGPNRLYVRLARTLAERGHVVLRFDLSGIGESDASEDDSAPEDRVVAEVRAAMQALAEREGVERFVLAGLCSGAAIAYAVACVDPRVVGVVMVNARVAGLSLVERARAKLRKLCRYYWRVALRRPGRALGALTRAERPPARSDAPATTASRAARRELLAGLVARGVGVLAVYSDSDIGLHQAHVALGRELRAAVADGRISLEVVGGADHTFTPLDSQQRLLTLVRDWLVQRHPTGAHLAGDSVAAQPRVG